MRTNALVTIETSFATALNEIMLGIVGFVPTLLGALLVFFIGLLLANWLKTFTIKLINVTKVGNLITNPAIKDFLKNAETSQKIEEVIGEIVRWVVLILFFMASMNILGLTTVSAFLNTVFGYLPNLFAAVFILLIGVVLAGILEKVVKGSLGGVDVSHSRFMGKFVSYTVMIISALAALSQMGIAQSFIEVIFTGFVATLAIAFGLGVGLGSKDIIKEILDEAYKNFKKR
ncbi:MAG: Conserved cytoplasmic membrane protein, CmpX protein [Candidatus Collierbacteria bacterium GW2011_GWA1_44_12]|uniref:Conserved cytoplasmic membrane protein, CmpX protein n=1 Tax=Candidatus Collierbacteria bacterium GW2011_GWA1_44_12 TaxID=1618376 RepID=A0A0G1GLX1_9BACT|nr:MAG: Conserved cytoplasmic membrane protein, CmpX protein [Candidatus Collierbacteria bacterium GW2011_GWA1_44_12]